MGEHSRISHLDFINYLNVFLMLVSCALAFYMPFEVLLVSYAFLGPLHYLTEISWLHDKKYFVKGRYDPLWLILPAIPMTIWVTSHIIPVGELVAIIVGVTFGAAAAMTFYDSLKKKLLCTLCVLIIVVGAVQFAVLSGIIALLLPSLIHVYIFTGAFILYGSLKSKSSSGHFSFVIFLICPLIFFLIQPAAGNEQLSPYVAQNIPPFIQLESGIRDLFGVGDNWNTTVAIIRFLAFAYTYHYLNWFSKTKIIRWHEVSTGRITLLCIAYFLMVSLYAFDYALGFIAAYFLSLIHVFLEFPLNHRSLVGIAAEYRERVQPSAASG